MKVSCRIVMEYGNEDIARSILESVKADNEGYVDGRLDGRKIVFTAGSGDAMALYHTVNDLLACIKAAESAIL